MNKISFMHKIRLLTIFLAILVIGIISAGCSQKQPQNTDAYFCPKDHCEERTIAEIASAKDTIDIAIYSFTSKELFDELVMAQHRGVRVRVVSDFLQSTIPSSVVPFLDGNGIEVRIYEKNITMHDKFAIFDSEIVLTGSYNWTTNADEKNRENIVILHDKDIAQKYGEEFFLLWANSG